MSGSRWQHLDLERPAPREPGKPASPDAGPAGDPAASAPTLPGAAPEERSPGAAPAPPVSTPPALRKAAGYYQLKQFQACADAAAEALAQAEAGVPGAHRLLGMALGRCDDPRGAAAALERAVTEEPGDPELRASLLSARIQAGESPDYPEPAPGALGEVSAAAAWLRGQLLLREGRAGEAARVFGEAAARFQAASPAETVGERLAACYIAQSISYLVASQVTAAQQSFGRLAARAGVPERLAAFARQLYEVAEAVQELEPGERAEAFASLAELVLQVRLRIRFHDHVRPVAMHWENLGTG